MTQESGRRTSSSHRRSARSVKNRPILVTGESADTSLQDASPSLEESMTEVYEQNPPVADVEAPRARKLPGFFSTVGRNANKEADKNDVAQARLARATRGKGASLLSAKSPESTEKEKSEPKKPAARPTTPARPASPFKTRYLIGMMLYLLGANFIGVFVTSFMQSNHLDSQLKQFNLFGAPFVVRTSTLVFLALLIIILVVLARLDLIPRSFSAMAGTPPPRRGTKSSSTRNTATSTERVKGTPTMRQGVKGADDDLYQAYRANLRKKRS